MFKLKNKIKQKGIFVLKNWYTKRGGYQRELSFLNSYRWYFMCIVPRQLDSSMVNYIGNVNGLLKVCMCATLLRNMVKPSSDVDVPHALVNSSILVSKCSDRSWSLKQVNLVLRAVIATNSNTLLTVHVWSS